MREVFRQGVHALETVTALLQRVRRAHPTQGLYEAADFQWWWRIARATDTFPQLFWLDPNGNPEAAVIATAWDGRTTLSPLVMPDATPDWITHVMERGLAHAAASGPGAVELEVDRDDVVLQTVLTARGFSKKGAGMVETWLAAAARPGISPLHGDYRLFKRLDTMPRPHHMIERGGADVETRLRQTSLYRPDLDLLILDDHDQVAAYGLFWVDPVSATGLVEPMRTEVGHQRRGLARHLLTTGVARLAEAGAARIKICYDPGNPAAKHLYLSTGFAAVKQTDLYAGPLPVANN